MAKKIDRSREPLTPAELDHVAEPTPDDVQRAAQRWRDDARPSVKDLLDASPE